ncbi:hypothetical protein NP493_1344g00023 [Ridgeia piscesae]|uniref:PRA1 family protein n=1 Tax=Ridgeia piscesae TaxID=27915 RepID=A0AAD9NF42_RIDPI|nr:hypothetical protein NP493_1344g00023 [Ridgeia piscesae]
MSMTLTNIRLREWFQKRRESVQPWNIFLSPSNFKLPKAVAPATKRFMSNIEKFQSNYIFVFLGLVAFCLLTSPLLLVAIATSLGACYIISLKNQDRKIRIMGRELSLVEQYTAVGIMSFPIFWLAGAGSAVFWVIGASFFAIALHASLYAGQEDIAINDEVFEELKVETV